MRGFVLSWLSVFAVSAAQGSAFEVLESDDTHVRVAFTLGAIPIEPTDVDGDAFVSVAPDIPGRLGVAGAPDLPSIGRLVGIPPDVVPTLEIVRVESDARRGRTIPFPIQRIIPAAEPGGLDTPTEDVRMTHRVYQSGVFPDSWATLGDVGRIRNQTVVPLRVTPVRQRGGGTPSLDVAERIVMDIRFAPLRRDRPGRWVPAREDASDRVMYDRLLLNADGASRWRKREAVPIHLDLRHGRLGTAEEIKITIRRDGLRRVDYSTLAGRGWPSDVPIADLELTTRGYDASALDVGGDPFVRTPIGIHVVDANTNGTFDGSDHFFFYAQNSKSHRGWTPPRDRYTWDNVYWLTRRSGAGTLMSVRSGALTGGVVSEPTDYAFTERFEENRYYHNYSFNEDDNVGLRQTVDHLMMTSHVFGTTLSHREPFDVWSPAPGTSLDLDAEFRNVDWQNGATFSLGIAIGTGTTPQVIPGLLSAQANRARPYSANLGNQYIGEGRHEFVHTVQNPLSLIALDWFRIGYRRQYVAHAGLLRFSNGDSTGRVRYTVSDYGSSSLLVFDITSPSSPVRITDADVSANGAIYRLDRIFQVYPGARVLLLIRDGRDVAVSLNRRWGDFDRSVRRWVEDNRAGEPYWEHPGIKKVLYEQLVTDFEGQMKAICAFIDEPFDNTLLNFSYGPSGSQPGEDVPARNGARPRELRDKQIAKGLYDGNGRWVVEMTEEQRDMFKRIAGDMLVEYGYAEDSNW